MSFKDTSKGKSKTSESTTSSEEKKVSRRKNVDIVELARSYKGLEGVSRAHRVAHAINFVAEKAPDTPIPPNVLTMMVYGYQHKPRMGTEEVNGVWHSISSARPILHEKYKRTVFIVKGMGVRAASSDNDGAEHGLDAAANRLVSAERALRSARSTIDANKVTNESKRSWIRKDIDSVLKVMASDGLMARLLTKKKPPTGEGNSSPPK